MTKRFNRKELYARVQVGMRVVKLQSSLAERVRQLERAEAELRSLSLTDDVTGIGNRRDFLIRAEQHLKIDRRTGKELLLLYADMDDLKQINDTFRHAEGRWRSPEWLRSCAKFSASQTSWRGLAATNSRCSRRT